MFLYEVFFSLFVINDVDFSGTMELDEFLETLASLGKPNFDPDAARRLMLEHDKDESGSIDANEFGLIMLNEFCQTDLPRGDLVDASTGQPWVIPASGHCVIQLSYQCDVYVSPLALLLLLLLLLISRRLFTSCSISLRAPFLGGSLPISSSSPHLSSHLN